MTAAVNPMRDVESISVAWRRNELLAGKHPHTLEWLHTTFNCATCGWNFTHATSIGQRKCYIHANRMFGLTGEWPCCGRRGQDARGCVPADHGTKALEEVWVVPAWMSLDQAPLRHTIVADGCQWLRVTLRRASDHKTPEEEAAYAAWEAKDGNFRLVSTNDIHCITFTRAFGDDTPTSTSLQELLEAQGRIVRYVW